MDDLRQQVADLEVQESDIERQLGNAETDEEARSITNSLNVVRNRLSEKREELRQLEEKEQQRAEVIEEKTHAAEIPFAVAGIDFTELPAEVIKLIDVVVKADRRRFLNEHAIEMEQADIESSNALSEIRGELEDVSKQLEDIYAKTAELKKEYDEECFLRQDAEAKRDAAVREREEAERQLEIANAEIRRLNDVIVDFQRAQEYNSRQTEQVTANDEEKENISAAVDAVKKLYARIDDWGSVLKVIKPDGSFELATRQQVQEEWSQADVPSFRPEDLDPNAENDQLSASETTADVEAPDMQFPEPDAEVPTNVLDGEVAPEGSGGVAQTETFEQNVIRRLRQLEARVFADHAELEDWEPKADGEAA